MSAPRVAIIYYSMYGHIVKMAESVKAGIEKAGGTATIHQIAETLPGEVLTAMHAPPKAAYPVISPADMVNYDAFIFGFPTRYGTQPAQVRAFWDATGQLWAKGALQGKFAGAFTSTATIGGGQETTIMSLISTLVHLGIVFVPLGYAHAFGQMSKLDQPRGGSPWGAGTLAAGDGSRQPSELELELASIQGKAFWELVSKHKF